MFRYFPSSYLYEFLVFRLKEARACVFAGSFFLLLWVSHYIEIAGLARYDLLFIWAVLLQVILLFHIIGLCLELFKTHPAIGSWSYPEAGYLKIATVPLYSGFMYAADCFLCIDCFLYLDCGEYVYFSL